MARCNRTQTTMAKKITEKAILPLENYYFHIQKKTQFLFWSVDLACFSRILIPIVDLTATMDA